MALRFDGYIFDCDGTLTDSMPLHAIAWQETMAKHGVEFSRERCYAMGGMPTVNIIQILGRENGLVLDAEQIATEKELAFFEHIQKLEPIQHTFDLVHQCIDEGKRISVASGSKRESVELQLKHIGLDDVFDIVVAAEDTQRHKPEPDVFLKAAELMGIPASTCVVYEDSDLGIQAAVAAKMAWVDIREVLAQGS